MLVSKKTIPALFVLLVSACIFLSATATLQGQGTEDESKELKVVRVGENFVDLNISDFTRQCGERTEYNLGVSYEIHNVRFNLNGSRFIYPDPGWDWIYGLDFHIAACRGSDNSVYTLTGLESGTTYSIGTGHSGYIEVTTTGLKSPTIMHLERLIEAEKGLQNGDLIRVDGGIDVYLLQYSPNARFKRLILNPEVFNSYGFRWEDVKIVHSSSLEALRAYVPQMYNSNIVRLEGGDGQLYMLYPNGDTGTKRRIHLTTQQIEQAIKDSIFQSIYDQDRYATLKDMVYEINATEFNIYTTVDDPITEQDELGHALDDVKKIYSGDKNKLIHPKNTSL